MMDYFKINGKAYNVTILSISEEFTILYSEGTGRTMAAGAPMVLSPLGTFYGHKVTIQRKIGANDAENERFMREYDELYDLVSEPIYVLGKDDGIDVEIVHNQETIQYMAYISSGSRDLKRIDPKNEKVYWDKLTLNIVAIEAQRKPKLRVEGEFDE